MQGFVPHFLQGGDDTPSTDVEQEGAKQNCDLSAEAPPPNGWRHQTGEFALRSEHLRGIKVGSFTLLPLVVAKGGQKLVYLPRRLAMGQAQPQVVVKGVGKRFVNTSASRIELSRKKRCFLGQNISAVEKVAKIYRQ